MANTFSKKMRLLALVSALALGGVATACNNNGGDNSGGENPPAEVEKHTIEWTIPENVTVKVDGYTELPKSVDSGTKLTFSVTPATGYEVTSVKLNNKRQTAKEGKYTITVSVNATIVVEVSAKLSKIEVTTNPTNLTYFAGQSVDVTGMVVTAYYESGTTTILTNGDDGYSISPSTFVGGETSFTVVYNEKEAKVDLAATVEYLVTLDVDGGTIDSTWLSTVEAMKLNNYKVDDKGVVTFSYYNNLPSDITLPVETEITKTESKFKGWGTSKTAKTYVTSITNSIKESTNLVACWQPELVQLTAVDLVVEENKPYLVIDGTFKAANEVYLFLYEGNDKISFTGDTYTGTKGQEFHVKFDLTKLKDATTTDGGTYEGKWMDIRFNAKDSEGNESTMEIFKDMVTVNTEKKIEVDGIVYLFALYNDALKVYYKKKDYVVSLAFSSDSEAKKDYLTFTGTIYEKALYGKTVMLSWWFTSEAPVDYGVIGNDGSFTVQVDLADIPALTNGYAHVTIVNSESDPTVLVAQANLLISNFTTEFPALDSKAGPNINHAVKYEGLDGYSYYAGYAWEGLMLYKVNEKKTTTMQNATLSLNDGVVSFELSGTYTGYTDGELKFGYDFQHNSNLDGQGWDYIYNDKDSDGNITYSQTAIMDTANSTFKVRFPISTLDSNFASMTGTWTFTVHYYFDGDSAKNVSADVFAHTEATFVKNGYQYKTICNGDTWNNISFQVTKTDAADTVA